MREEQYMILVCGGRDHIDRKYIWSILDAYRFLYGKFILVTGACCDKWGNGRGADKIAEDWARSRQCIYIGFPAEWLEYGKAAGMKRNEEMRDIARPNLVVAFRGGPGTANMARIADDREIPVHKWGWDT